MVNSLVTGLDLKMADWQELLKQPEIQFWYTNWKGVQAKRSVEPLNIQYKFGDRRFYDNREHIFLIAFDLDKNENREFMVDKIMFDCPDFYPLGYDQKTSWRDA